MLYFLNKVEIKHLHSFALNCLTKVSLLFTVQWLILLQDLPHSLSGCRIQHYIILFYAYLFDFGFQPWNTVESSNLLSFMKLDINQHSYQLILLLFQVLRLLIRRLENFNFRKRIFSLSKEEME